ncbi:MAG: penicillin-binding protein activator [Rickettsiaceae bacterium]|nr:penicillin-binding protein activator [Rickettsiaceae bacterium]
MTNNIRQKAASCIIFLSLILFGCSGTEEIAPKINVAIFMPLSGKNADHGKRLSSLIKIGIEDGLEGHINLVTYDVPDEESAKIMMDKVIAKKTKIILGPLFSDTTSAIAEKAEKNGITVISLSNNPVLAGNSIYVLGHAPMKQTERLVSYFTNKGHKDFILLLPKTRYSSTITEVVKDILLSAEANPMQPYYYDSPSELPKILDEILAAVDKINEEADSLKPIIYTAGDAEDTKLILSALKQHNLDQKAIIAGDGRIDIDFNEPISLTFTGSLNYKNYQLDKKAKENAGISHLTLLDLLAYDAGRMTAHYIGHGLDYELFVSRLNKETNYTGASGAVKFHDNIAVRKYDIIERKGTDYTTIDKDQSGL